MEREQGGRIVYEAVVSDLMDRDLPSVVIDGWKRLADGEVARETNRRIFDAVAAALAAEHAAEMARLRKIESAARQLDEYWRSSIHQFESLNLLMLGLRNALAAPAAPRPGEGETANLRAALRLCAREISELLTGSPRLSYAVPVARWVLGDGPRPPSLAADWREDAPAAPRTGEGE